MYGLMFGKPWDKKRSLVYPTNILPEVWQSDIEHKWNTKNHGAIALCGESKSGLGSRIFPTQFNKFVGGTAFYPTFQKYFCIVLVRK